MYAPRKQYADSQNGIVPVCGAIPCGTTSDQDVGRDSREHDSWIERSWHVQVGLATNLIPQADG